MKNFFAHFRGDLFGGITAGIVALPLALAFGVTSGLGPSAGLYGAIFISFFAAFFGGTPTQISGPTAPMTAVTLVIVATIVGLNEGNVEKALPAILMVFLLAGLFQILIGVVGIGKYIKYIPYPVVSGFMTAIGVMILVTQILPTIGYYAKEDTDLVNSFKPKAEEVILTKILDAEAGQDILVLEDFEETISRAKKITSQEITAEAEGLANSSAPGVMGALRTLPRALKHINWLELALTLITIFIIYGFKRITTKVPSSLVALLAVSSVAYFLGLDYRPIEKIPEGFPEFKFEIFSGFSLSSVVPYIFTAVSLAFLGAIDSLLTSVVADNMTKTKHKPNKELVGQGIGNSIAALFGGIPGAGATIRTVVNINAGGKTRLSGMVAGLLLLIVLLALGPVASQIPAAVLAGILITVGIGVMDYKGLKAIPKMPKDINLKVFKLSSEVLIMLIVLFLSVVWNLVNAVGIGLILSSIIFMKKMGDFTAKKSEVTTLASLPEQMWKKEDNFPKQLTEQVYVKQLDGPLFFGYTSDFQTLAKQIPQTASHVIIKMDRVSYMDQSGLYAFEDVLLDLKQKNISISLIAPKVQPQLMMERIRIIPNLIPEDCIFEKFQDSMNYIKERTQGV